MAGKLRPFKNTTTFAIPFFTIVIMALISDLTIGIIPCAVLPNKIPNDLIEDLALTRVIENLLYF